MSLVPKISNLQPHKTMTEFVFQRATRKQVRHKIAIYGPSGSGKTLGALSLARALSPSGRIAVIDTENSSASYYADRFEFDVLELHAPYTSERYLKALDAAIQAGYDVVVIDSVSHQWAGEGGILARKEALDARGGNKFTNWATFTAEHERFKAAIVSAPVHVIMTLRAKTEYAIVDDDTRKAKPQKMGLSPVQRDGFEYECGIVFELQMDHRALASKDRTGLFGDQLIDLTDPSVGARLRAWAEQGDANPEIELADEGQHAEIHEAIRMLSRVDEARGRKASTYYAERRARLTSAQAAELLGQLVRAYKEVIEQQAQTEQQAQAAYASV